MNSKISPLVALAVIAAAIAACALIYLNLPTGMVVHMTAKAPNQLPGTQPMLRTKPHLPTAPKKVPDFATAEKTGKKP